MTSSLFIPLHLSLCILISLNLIKFKLMISPLPLCVPPHCPSCILTCLNLMKLQEHCMHALNMKLKLVKQNGNMFTSVIIKNVSVKLIENALKNFGAEISENCSNCLIECLKYGRKMGHCFLRCYRSRASPASRIVRIKVLIKFIYSH
jgi:hypothetical protein